MPITLPKPAGPSRQSQGGGSKPGREDKRRRANTEGEATGSTAGTWAAGKPAGSSAAAAEEKKGKEEDQREEEEGGKKDKGKGKSGKTKDVLHALVRSALSSQQNARTVNGLLLDTWVVKSVDKVAISMLEQGSN